MRTLGEEWVSRSLTVQQGKAAQYPWDREHQGGPTRLELSQKDPAEEGYGKGDWRREADTQEVSWGKGTVHAVSRGLRGPTTAPWKN